MIPALTVLFACAPEPEPVPAAPPQVPSFRLDRVQVPTAPWDTFWATYQGTAADFGLDAIGPDGDPLSTVPVRHSPGDVEWVPDEPLAPGTYFLEGLLGVALDVPEVFEVLPWGADPDFEPLHGGEALVFDLGTGGVAIPAAVGVLIQQHMEHYTLVFEVVEDRGDTVDYRIALVTEGLACSAHQDTAEVGPGGRFDWAADEILFPLYGGTGGVYDAEFALGVLGRDARGSVRGRVDIAELTTGDPLEVCDLLGSLGMPCGPCPGSELETCVDVAAQGIEGRRAPAPWEPGTTLASCTVAGDAPLDFDIPPIECAPVSCSTAGSAPGALWVAGVLAWARRRRVPLSARVTGPACTRPSKSSSTRASACSSSAGTTTWGSRRS